MAIAEDVSTPTVTRGTHGTSTTCVSASFSPPAGSLLIVQAVIGWDSTGANPTLSCSDSVGGTYSTGITTKNATNPVSQGTIFYRYLASAPGAMTVTATSSSAASKSMQLGVRVVTGASATIGAVASSTTAAIGNLVTTTVGSRVYCIGGAGLNGTMTPNANTTNIDAWNDTVSGDTLLIGRSTSLTVTPASTAFGWNPPASVIWGAVEVLPDLGGTAASAVTATGTGVANDAVAIGGLGIANAATAMLAGVANDAVVNIMQPVVAPITRQLPYPKITYTIYARDRNLLRQGIIEDYQKASFKLRFNDVGTWEITVNRTIKEAIWLTTPGWGIEVVMNLTDGTRVPLIAGPMQKQKHTKSKGQNLVVVNGYSDEFMLKTTIVSPEPWHLSAPYNTQEFDVRTGIASTVVMQYADVSLGSFAVPARRNAFFVLGADAGAGGSLEARGRWTELLAFIQGLLLNRNVGFKITQTNQQLVFSTFVPTDRTSTVILSEGLGNLSEWEYTIEGPTGNFIFTGGEGTGTGRIIVEDGDVASMTEWGRREYFNDGGDADGDVEVGQVGEKSVAENAAKSALSITPTDTNSTVFGRDYFLGDRVAIQVEGPSVPLSEVVREVNLELSNSGTQVIKPVVGSPSGPGVLAAFTEFRRRTLARLNAIERR